jgi:hypothetical protein
MAGALGTVDLFTTREDLAIDLSRYGEDALWLRPFTASTGTMRRISERALDRLLDGPQTASGDSMYISRALALAAVEVFEGHTRPLSRDRRRAAKETPAIPSVRALIAKSLDLIDVAYRGR